LWKKLKRRIFSKTLTQLYIQTLGTILRGEVYFTDLNPSCVVVYCADSFAFDWKTNNTTFGVYISMTPQCLRNVLPKDVFEEVLPKDVSMMTHTMSYVTFKCFMLGKSAFYCTSFPTSLMKTHGPLSLTVSCIL
jgi:hypothetical protein